MAGGESIKSGNGGSEINGCSAASWLAIGGVKMYLAANGWRGSCGGGWRRSKYLQSAIRNIRRMKAVACEKLWRNGGGSLAIQF